MLVTAVQSAYPPDPTEDIVYPDQLCGYNGVESIECAFNYARTTENTQLGTAIPMLTLPEQTEWDYKSDGEKALWLVNRERIDRGLVPLTGVEANVTEVAHTYAQYMLAHDCWGHTCDDDRTPIDRLEANPAIGVCHDEPWPTEPIYPEVLGYVTYSHQSLPIDLELIVYYWIYVDTQHRWLHRRVVLAYPYNDNSGSQGEEGFLGIGRASGGPYQGYDTVEIIVMNVFDPCSEWPLDADEDGILNISDNCPTTPNGPNGGTCTAGAIGSSCVSNEECGDGGVCSMNQEDFDDDVIGDVCDTCTDTDNDGRGNPGFLFNTCPLDNCPDQYNQNQADRDQDGIGDVCDPDNDNDGVCDPGDADSTCTGSDNCPLTPNGPAKGTCLAGVSYKIARECINDEDCGENGFCSMNQEDTYQPGDSIGDACYLCESDFDCDKDVDGFDAATFKADFGRSGLNRPCINEDQCDGDFTCNGDVSGSDAALFKSDYGRSQFNNPCPACPSEGDWCLYQ
jgi:hypothetical protein